MHKLLIEGLQVACSRSPGQHPSILFLHGAFCDHEDWNGQLEALKGHYTVAALDHRGHGRHAEAGEVATVESLAQDASRIIDLLDLGQTIVVGHSLGARVALQMAADRPGQLAGIVLVDGSRSQALKSRPDPERTVAAAKAKPVEPRPAPAGADLIEGLARHFETMFFGDVDPAVKAKVMATVRANRSDQVLALSAAVTRWDIERVEPVLEAIGKALPVLAIQSTSYGLDGKRHTLTQDDTTTPWLDLLRSYLPQLDVLILPGLGHFNMMEDPTRVSRAIDRFADAPRR